MNKSESNQTLSGSLPVMKLSAAGVNHIGDIDMGDIIQCLRQSGLVLLRNFEVSLASFEAFTTRLCEHFHDVGTRQSLVASDGDGYTSEVHQKNFNLFVHSEGAYRPWPPPPDLCFFNCVQSWGNTGGETTLVDGVTFLDRLPADLHARFDQLGIIYEARWEEDRWRTEFSVESKDELKALLSDRPEYEYQLEGDTLQIRCHAAATSSSLGEVPAFANGLLAHLPNISHPRWRGLHVYSKNSNQIYFGDGQIIQDSVIHKLIDIQDEIAVHQNWMRNDLLILDNRRFMHGRRMTDGDCDRVIRSRFGNLKQKYLNSSSATA